MDPERGIGTRLNIPRKAFELQNEDDLELEEEPSPKVNHAGPSLSATGDWVQFRHEIAVNKNLVLETTAKGDKQCVQDLHVKVSPVFSAKFLLINIILQDKIP